MDFQPASTLDFKNYRYVRNLPENKKNKWVENAGSGESRVKYLEMSGN
jgi:hypothetical protein